jgi:hypothetical protein
MFEPTIALARASGVAAVIAEAQRDPVFVVNNAGGPFARRIHGDAAFRDQVASMSADAYVALVQDYCDGQWPEGRPYFSVGEAWLPSCPSPLLILPGSDPFHPTGVARAIERLVPNARCLAVDCRAPANLPSTVAAIRDFLKQHTPA